MNYIIVILLALCFILFFSVKIVLPNSYFTYSDPFIRNESISLKNIFIEL